MPFYFCPLQLERRSPATSIRLCLLPSFSPIYRSGPCARVASRPPPPRFPRRILIFPGRRARFFLPPWVLPNKMPGLRNYHSSVARQLSLYRILLFWLASSPPKG